MIPRVAAMCVPHRYLSAILFYGDYFCVIFLTFLVDPEYNCTS